MSRMKHNQPEPLPWKPMRADRLDYMWDMLQASPGAYDDFVMPRDQFDVMVMSRDGSSYELGDGVGLLTVIPSYNQGAIQLAMFDWIFKPRFPWFSDLVNYLFHDNRDLHKLVAGITDDRHVARDLVKYLGFSQEVLMRKAVLRGTEYHDIELWGLFRDDFLDRRYGPSEVYL